MTPDPGLLRDHICTTQEPKVKCVRQVDFDERFVLHRDTERERVRVRVRESARHRERESERKSERERVSD